MTFPIPESSKAVLRAQDLWRVNTVLESSGDIFESEVSGLAFVIGPQSDINQVLISYFDDLEADTINEVLVDVNKPWIGRIDALASTKYSTGDRARIFFTPNVWLPPGLQGGVEGTATDDLFVPPSAPSGSNILIIPPRIEVLQYLKNTPTIIAPRVDKRYLFESITYPFTGVTYYLVPFYGRRFATIQAKTLNLSGAVDMALYVYGYNFTTTSITDSVYTGFTPTLTGSGTQEKLLAWDMITKDDVSGGELATVTMEVASNGVGTEGAGGWNYIGIAVRPADDAAVSNEPEAISIQITTKD